MRKKLLSSLPLLFISLYLVAQKIEFSNQNLKVVYNQSVIQFYRLTSNSLFFEGSIPGAKNAVLKPETSPLWGRGKTLFLEDAGGNLYKISLFESLSFAAVQKEIRNKTGDELRISKDKIMEGSVRLEVGPEMLRTMSTAGLNPAVNSTAGYLMMTVGDPGTNRGMVFAYLTNDRGSGIVYSEAKEGKVFLKAQTDYGDLRIPAGRQASSEILLIGYANDVRLSLEEYAEAIARYKNIVLPPQPSVYCTWYHDRASDEKKIAANTDFAYERLKPYGFDVMQIDDYWQLGVKDNGPRRNFTGVRPDGPYPGGMKPTADYIRSKGFRAGIWYIPFAGSWNDPYWQDKMDYFLKEGASPDNHFYKMECAAKTNFKKGEAPYEARWGGTCLDLTNPKSQEYVKFIANRLSNEWGYKYFKVDGLWTGTGTRSQYINSEYKDDDLGMQIRFNPAITPIEAYARGLELIREGAGKDLFLLGCCAPQNMRSFGPAIGRVNAMRVGPDNGANPKLLIRGPQFSGRVYFFNKRVWYNDPDPVYVRSSFPEEMAKTSVSWVAISGSMHSSSEQYSTLPASRLDILVRSLPSHSLKTVRPVDFLENDPATVWLLTDNRNAVQKDVVGLFNWDVNKSVNIAYPLHRIGLPTSEKYVGFDFWANRFIPPFSDSIQGLLAPGGCKIISVRPVKDYPQVVSTSRHITQGVIDLSAEKWDARSFILSGTSELVGKDSYELRIVIPAGDNSWLAESVTATGPVSASFTQEGSCIRVKLLSATSQKTGWQVKFKKGSVTNKSSVAGTLSAKVDYDNVQLTWNKVTSFQYRLSRNGKLIGEVSAENFTDSDIEPGKEYSYRIEARNWDGSWTQLGQTTVKVPENYTVPAVPALPNLYCTDLNPAKNADIKINQTFSGKPIVLNGVLQKNGIGTKAPSTIIYNIPVDAKRFVSTLSLEGIASRSKGTKVAATIMGDVLEMGEPVITLARSPMLDVSKNNVWHFDVELDSRLKQIWLVVETSGDLCSNCEVEWINTGFVKPVKRGTWQGEPNAKLNYQPGVSPSSWAVATAESVMARYPDYRKAYWKDWSYVQGYMFFGFERLYQLTGDKRYLDYMKKYIDNFVDSEGNYTGEELKNLDNLLTGSTIVALYKHTGDERYKKAIAQFRKRFDTYPRSEGQFWHSQGTPNMWVDGIFMGQMFLLSYGKEFGDAAYSVDEAARQIITFARKCKKGNTGFYYHAWTETPKNTVWADTVTGVSPEVWSEGLGWYALVIPELLSVMPKNHPQRKEVLDIYYGLAEGLKRTQDPATGGWYLVVDKGDVPGNWIDPSGTAMFVYSIQYGMELGLLDRKTYAPVAQKGYNGLLTFAKINENGLVDVHGAADGITIRKSFEDYVSYKPRVVNAKEALAGFLWASVIMESKKIKKH